MGFVLYEDAALTKPVITRYVDAYRQFTTAYKGTVRAATWKEVENLVSKCTKVSSEEIIGSTGKTIKWNSYWIGGANRGVKSQKTYHLSLDGKKREIQEREATSASDGCLLMVSSVAQKPFEDLIGDGKYYACCANLTGPTMPSPAYANASFLAGRCVIIPKEYTDSVQCNKEKDVMYPQSTSTWPKGLDYIGKNTTDVKYAEDYDRAIKIGYLTVGKNEYKTYYYDKSEYTVSQTKTGPKSECVTGGTVDLDKGTITLKGQSSLGVSGALYVLDAKGNCFNTDSDVGVYFVTYCDAKYEVRYWNSYVDYTERSSKGKKPIHTDYVSKSNLDEKTSYKTWSAPTKPAAKTEDLDPMYFYWTNESGTELKKTVTPVHKVEYIKFVEWDQCNLIDNRTKVSANTTFKVDNDWDFNPTWETKVTDEYTIPEGEPKEGYTFKHWRVKKKGAKDYYNTVEYKPGDKGEITNTDFYYVAIYDKIVTYTVTYKVQNKEHKKVTGITSGASHSIIDDPSLPSSTTADGAVVVFKDTVDTSKDLKPKRKVTTKYTKFNGWSDGSQKYKKPEKYTVRKDVTFNAAFTTTDSSSVKVPTPDAKSGYTFKGYKAADGTVYQPDDTITNPDDTYTGVWEKDKPDQVTATYKDDAGTQVTKKTYDKGSSHKILNWTFGDHAESTSDGDNCEFYDPISKKVVKNKKIQITKKNYKFSKWKLSDGKTTVTADSDYTFSKSETLTAVFTYSTVKQVATHSAVVLDGYQFEGWKCLANSKVYGANVTITDPASGRYEAVLTKVKKYNVRYYKEKADTIAYKTFTVNEGDAHILEVKLADIPASTGKGVNPSTVVNNINKDTVDIPQNVSTTAKSMTFWQIGDTKPDYKPKDPIVVNGNMNIYPKWTGGVKTYTFIVPEPKQYDNYTFSKYTYVNDSGKTVEVKAGDKLTASAASKTFEILATYTPNKKATVGRLFLIKGSDGATSATLCKKKLQELVGTDWTLGGSVRSFDIPRTWKIPVYSKDGYNQKRWVYVHYVPDGWEMWRFNWNSDGSDFGVISWKDNTFYALSIRGSIISGSDSLKKENIFTATSDLYDNGITGGCTRSKKTEADDDSSVPSK